MAPLAEALRDGARNAFCAWLSFGAPARAWIADATSGIPGVSLGTGLGEPYINGVQGLVCDPTSPPTGTVTPPQASQPGGFCDLAIYRGTYQYTESGTVRTAPFPDVYGPIEEIFTGGTTEPSTSIGIRCRGDARPGLGGSRPAPGPPGTSVGLRGSSTPIYSEVSILTVDYVGGAPDDCPIPPDQEVSDPRVTDDITYDAPDGTGPITGPFDFDFRLPIINLTGELVVPIEISGNEINFIAQFNVSTGDISLNIGTGNQDESCCCPSEEPGEDGDVDGERRLSSVTVTPSFTALPRGVTELFSPGTGSVFLPNIGLLIFEEIIDGQRVSLQPVEIQVSPQHCPVPEGRNVIGYTVVPRGNAVLATRPVFVTVETVDNLVLM